jgi:hypothetical protein
MLPAGAQPAYPVPSPSLPYWRDAGAGVFLRAVRLAHRAFRIVRLDRGRHDRQHFGKSGGPFDEHVKIHDLAIEGFTPCCGVVAFRVSLS